MGVWNCLTKTSIPLGDENYFIDELARLKNNGFWNTFSGGISYTYLSISYLLSELFNMSNLYAMRLSSLISAVLFLISLAFVIKKYLNTLSIQIIAFLAIVHITVTLQFYFSAINDYTFFLFILWSLEHANSYRIKLKYKPLIYSFIFLFLAWLTRPMTIMYIPGIFLIIFWKNLNLRAIKQISLSALPGVIIFLMIQTPALITYGSFKHENKNPDDLPYNWSQRQYVAQLMYERGTLNPPEWATWEDVAMYLNTHGENALPRNLKESLTWDLTRTIREFFYDSISSLRYTLRFTGIFLFFLIPVYLRNKKLTFNPTVDFFYATIALYLIFFFSFIIITNVEVRWLLLSSALIVIAGAVKLEEFKPKMKYYNGLLFFQLLLLSYSTFNFLALL